MTSRSGTNATLLAPAWTSSSSSRRTTKSSSDCSATPLLTGQRAAEEVKAEAANQADALLEEARKKAQGIVNRAQREREGIKAEIGRLRSVEQDVQARCRTILVGALDALGQHETAPPPEPQSLARETAAAER